MSSPGSRAARPCPYSPALDRPQHIVLLSAEDSPADTIKPRLVAMGADLSRIYIYEATRQADGSDQLFSLETDIAILEQVIAEKRIDLVAVDPMTAYLGRIDGNADVDIRRVLAPFAALADRTGVAVVAIMHVGKSSEGRQAQHRILGGVGFVNTARIALGVGWADPTVQRPSATRYLLWLKGNICAPCETLAFSIDAPDPEQPALSRSCGTHPPRPASMPIAC